MDVEFETEVEPLLTSPDSIGVELLPGLIAYTTRPITTSTTITMAAPVVVESAVFRSLSFMLCLLRVLPITCTESHPEDFFVVGLEEKVPDEVFLHSAYISSHEILPEECYEAGYPCSANSCHLKALDLLLRHARLLDDALHARAVHIDTDLGGMDLLRNPVCAGLHILRDFQVRFRSHIHGDSKHPPRRSSQQLPAVQRANNDFVHVPG